MENMNRHLIHLGLIAAMFVAGVLFVGCAGTRVKQLSGPDFLKQAKQTDLVGSFVWTSYIGSTHLRAYLEYGHPALIGNGMRVTIYWVPLSELPSNLVERIRDGKRLWINSMDRIDQGVSGRDAIQMLERMR